ncbi:MAG: hypothetical protein ACYC6P_12020 [Ignavibacteriaceae bacterium]
MKNLFLLFAILFPLLSIRAGNNENDHCTSSPSFVWSGQIGGLYLPSEGTIKVLTYNRFSLFG